MAYCDLLPLKTYLGIASTSTTEDAMLSLLIASAQKAIDNDRGYSFEASADATRKFTVGVDTDGAMLMLDTWMAATPTTIITDADATSPVTLASTEYILHPRNAGPYYAIELLSSSDNSWTYTTNPENGVTVASRWAWSATVPADISHACMRLAGYYYRQKDAGVFDTTAIPDAGIIQVPQGIPRDVRIILDSYPRGFGG